MARYELPTIDQLRELGTRHETAITIYTQTSPAPDQWEASHLGAKSAFDRAIRTLRDREEGLRHNHEQALREHWEKIRTDEAWNKLSRSMAIFIADDFADLYVLPNELEDQLQVGNYFDLGQIVRAVTTPQSAFALTLSAHGWNLWEATATTRAAELDLQGEHATDVADATNRATVRDRGHVRRLVGDEGKKVLLEKYAKRVAEAVKSELYHQDPNTERPLFVFATDPLLDMYANADTDHRIVHLPGGPDELRADEIDAVIREHLSTINAETNNALVERIGDGVGRGLVATDLSDISRAAATGAVETLVYDFTIDILGTVDDTTGALQLDDSGYDLLSRIAIAVLDTGGTVVAVRAAEITADIWNQKAIAGLRFAPS